MNMNGAAFCQRFNRCQLFAGHGAQTVRCNPQHRTRQGLYNPFGALHQALVAVERMDEASLAFDRRQSTETGMRVKHWQQGQADTGFDAAAPIRSPISATLS